MSNIKNETQLPVNNSSLPAALIHDTDKTIPRNNVETVFSENTVMQLEYLIHWFWDNSFVIADLMQMLHLYVKTNPQSYGATSPACMVNLVSNIIQLQEQLNELVHTERIWDWVNRDDKYYQPQP